MVDDLTRDREAKKKSQVKSEESFLKTLTQRDPSDHVRTAETR